MMKGSLGFRLCGFLALLASSLAARDIVLLGDSLSDDGVPMGYAGQVQLALQTNSIYPQTPYYAGRWSSGPTWIEFAAKTLGSTLLDFGGGGASTGTVPAQLPPLPQGFANLTQPTMVPSNNLFQQYDQLLLSANGANGPLSSAPLYVTLIGLNDLFSIAFANTSVTAQAVAQNVQTVLGNVYQKGGRDFVIALNPTSASALPAFSQPALYGLDPSKLPIINQQLMVYSTLLMQIASSFPAQHPGARVTLYNFGQAFTNVLSNAASYGITNIQDACYLPPKTNLTGFNQHPIGRGGGTQRGNPTSYAFWDQIHPTTQVHQAIGADFVNQVGQSLFGLAISPGRAPGSAPPLPVVLGPSATG